MTIPERQNKRLPTSPVRSKCASWGRKGGYDPEQEELKYNVFILHCFSRRRKAQLYHPASATALHTCAGWGSGEHRGHGWRDVMLSQETRRLPESRRPWPHKGFWAHGLRGLVSDILWSLRGRKGTEWESREGAHEKQQPPSFPLNGCDDRYVAPRAS